MSPDNADWVTSAADASGFGTYVAGDEFLHGTGPEGDSLTETWYWGFNVPAAAINCFIYCWVHPNLDVATAGVIIYRGIKPQHLAAELFDMRAFLSSAVVGDGSDIQIPNGLRVQVIDPLKHIQITFNDPGRETELDVQMTAVAGPIMRSNGKHFEQIMRTRGHLVLRGERHEVDGFNVRDRSWGELRPEDHNPSPPYNWVTGVFDDGDWAFNVGSLDDPVHDPHWLEDFPVPPDAAFKDGWLSRKGRASRIARASKRTEREPETLCPTRLLLEIETEEGEVFHLTGDVVAGVPWGGWHNITSHLALVRWELDGRVGYGEGMDVQWNDYVWRYGQRHGREPTAGR